jgi:hypothetical protein
MKHEQEVMGKVTSIPKTFHHRTISVTMHPSGLNKDSISSFHEWASYPYFVPFDASVPKGIPPAPDECGLYIHIPGAEHEYRKILYDNYAGMFATFDDFCQVMKSMHKYF